MPAPHRSVFTGRMPFLTANQQCQSTEGKCLEINKQKVSLLQGMSPMNYFLDNFISTLPKNYDVITVLILWPLYWHKSTNN